MAIAIEYYHTEDYSSRILLYYEYCFIRVMVGPYVEFNW